MALVHSSSDDRAGRYVMAGAGGPDGPRYSHLPDLILDPARIRSGDRLLSELARDARQITDRELYALLRPDQRLWNWRDRLVAAFLIGIGRRTRFGEDVRALLLADETGCTTVAYVFVLAASGTDRDAATLTAFLDASLSGPDPHDDRDWALGALLHLDRRLGTARAAAYYAGGPAERWRAALPYRPVAEARAGDIGVLCGFAG